MPRHFHGRGQLSFLRKTWAKVLAVAALAIASLAMPAAVAQDTEGEKSRTVLGPRNPELHDGARALLDGDAERGVELTLLGLQKAHGRRERQAGLSNLCAGYLLLEKYETSLGYCNTALEENPRNWRALNNRAMVYLNLQRYEESQADLDLAQEIAPNARTLKEARGLLRDETDPVTPNILIDDRRDAAENEGG